MNKVVLIGRLTRDPELRKTQSGTSYVRFTLAVNRRFRSNSQSNDPQQRDADFIGCIAWDRRAEVMQQYLTKGAQIAIEGRIQTGSYERDGQRVYTTDIVVENFEFLESRDSRMQRSNTPMSDTGSSADAFDQNFDSFDDVPMLEIADDDLPF